MDDEIQENVLGAPLETCSLRPLTGFTRSGCCDFEPLYPGQHTICVVATADFLDDGRAQCNDLSTPIPEFEFAVLKPGDPWCLCAACWL